jgi:hypothetical protein
MIPLVSARREVELVKNRIDAVAAAVRNESRKDFTYRLGVMVETPRAALRAGEIALVEVGHAPVIRTWNVVHLQSRLLSPAAEALRYFILEEGEAFLAEHDRPWLQPR